MPLIDPTLIDVELWASCLEQTDLYPTDFQMAMKEMIKEGLVQNLDADVNRRRKDFIKSDLAQKSEKWILLQ